MRVLFILTKTQEMGSAGHPTGFHYQEVSDPYYILAKHHIDIDFSTVDGTVPRPAPDTYNLEKISDNEPSVQKMMKDEIAQEKIKSPLNLKNLSAGSYEGVYFPGGHGTMWDLPNNKDVASFLADMDKAGKPIMAVCHGPAAFASVTGADGQFLIKGRKINCFTNSEERMTKKDGIMPFALETKLKELGGVFECSKDMEPHVAVDKNLVTGQNPASAKPAAEAFVDLLKSGIGK